MAQHAAKRLKVDLDLTVASSSPATSTTRHSSTMATSTRTSTASTTVTATTAPPAPKLASIFAPPASSKGKWCKNLGGSDKGKMGCGHYVWGQPKGSAKVAAFDLDGVVIKTPSGRVVAKDKDDWGFWATQVSRRIRELHQQGYAIVILTNQALNESSKINFKAKLPLICSALDVPLHTFAAWGRDEYRKPAPGMWKAYVEHFNDGIAIGERAFRLRSSKSEFDFPSSADYTESLFVGDAAGRPGDHNDSDRKLAINCGLRFFTPEEFFLGAPVNHNWSLLGWDPSTYDHNAPLYSPASSPLLPRRLSEFDQEQPPEVIVFVGYPGSGKTSFFKKHFEPKGYVHVNQDTLKTRDACVRLVRKCLSSTSPRNCVVDNTSPASSTRAEYISLIRSEFPDVKIRCFHFTAGVELAMHNSVYRALYDAVDKGNGKKREVLPEIAFNSFRSRFEMPTLAEGFDELKRINFKFDGTPAQLAKWQQWLADIYPYSARGITKPKTTTAAGNSKKRSRK
ncbi:Polynucleotide kinase 3 phosphatase-domain containing protein [Rhodotorula toruloides]|uniref:Polynucleotide kinase 3 phosphatase-domain containing protein n=1 Tax=Rhodotorula toruloides TaxID=5286 RepID=A0A2T0A4M1_RHOTO|nr:Polynucleotide kinase 3 phosphatase-domain containing protein [Rhodotorula toruloides]